MFKIDSPVFNGLTRICDVMILNVLWVICSIPIITAGAATAALYYSLFKIIRERDSSVVRMFFHSFSQNLKQGCVMTVIFILSGLFLYVDIQACKITDNLLTSIAMIILIVLLIIWGMVISYAFPILAQFENTIMKTLKNAFLMSIGNLKRTIIIVLLNAIPVILFIGLPDVFVLLLPVLMMFGIGLIALVNSKMLANIFDTYISGAETEELQS